MTLTLKLGAAIGLAALAACSQSGQDNNAENMDANSAMTADETVLPVDDNAANADTLGNQLDQLNASDSANAAADTSGNSTNSY
jgi:hypothetical protein